MTNCADVSLSLRLSNGRVVESWGRLSIGLAATIPKIFPHKPDFHPHAL